MNARPLVVTAALAALAAWVSAQPGSGPTTAHESLTRFRANRGLYEDFTRHALELGDRNTPLDRADECRKVADRLGREIDDAVRANDADRLAEVSDHLRAVADDALAPALAEARKHVTPVSRDYPRLQEVHQQAFAGLSRTASAVPADGELAKFARTRAAREELSAAAARIGPPPAE